MRRWGIVITTLYAAVVTGFLAPFIVWQWGVETSWTEVYQVVFSLSDQQGILVLTAPWVVLLVGGHAALLFLSVDTSHRRLKPRRHLAYSAATVGAALALLTFSAVSSLFVAFLGDEGLTFTWGDGDFDSLFSVLFPWWWLGLWAMWGGIFYTYYRGAPTSVNRAVSWLLRSSVLELLIVVPTHVVVRRREDCCAPVATGFGIATGIAVMLMCFGPGILSLYRKRIEAYRPKKPKKSAA